MVLSFGYFLTVAVLSSSQYGKGLLGLCGKITLALASLLGLSLRVTARAVPIAEGTGSCFAVSMLTCACALIEAAVSNAMAMRTCWVKGFINNDGWGFFNITVISNNHQWSVIASKSGRSVRT